MIDIDAAETGSGCIKRSILPKARRDGGQEAAHGLKWQKTLSHIVVDYGDEQRRVPTIFRAQRPEDANVRDAIPKPLGFIQL